MQLHGCVNNQVRPSSITADAIRPLSALCRPSMASAIATRLTGSADLFGPQWEAGLPGCLAAARRPGFGINAVSGVAGPSAVEVAKGAVAAATAGAMVPEAQVKEQVRLPINRV